MSIGEIILLLNDPNTTVNFIVNKLQTLIDNFQKRKLSTYLNDFKSKIEHNEIQELVNLDLDEQTLDIYVNLKNDCFAYFNEYTNTITDEVLDLVNENKIDKKSAFNFLAIVTTMRDILGEEKP
jgi:hypothetical protein